MSTAMQDEGNNHDFQIHSYTRLSKCNICNGILMGFKNQGYQCKKCGLNSHDKCRKKAIKKCVEDSAPKEHVFENEITATPLLCDVCKTKSMGIVSELIKCRKCDVVLHTKCKQNLVHVECPAPRPERERSRSNGSIGIPPKSDSPHPISKEESDNESTGTMHDEAPSSPESLHSGMHIEMNNLIEEETWTRPKSPSPADDHAPKDFESRPPKPPLTGPTVEIPSPKIELAKNNSPTRRPRDSSSVSQDSNIPDEFSEDSALGRLFVQIIDSEAFYDGKQSSHVEMDTVSMSFGGKIIESVNASSSDTSRRMFTKLMSSAQGRKSVEWNYETVYEFPLYDFSCRKLTIVVGSINSNVTKPIGMIVIPFESLRMNSASGWYEIFPCTEDSSRFILPSPMVEKTGIDFPVRSLGYLNVQCHFLSSIKLTSELGSYLSLSKNSGVRQRKKRNTYQIGKDSVTEVRKNMIRISVAQKYALKHFVTMPIEVFQSLKSWESPMASGLFLANMEFLILYVQLWQVPFIISAIIVLYCIFGLRDKPMLMNLQSVDPSQESTGFIPYKRYEDSLFVRSKRGAKGRIEPFVIWNEDIVDPISKKSIIERTTLAVTDDLQGLEQVTSNIATSLEKCILLLNGSDPNASLIALGAVLLLGITLSVSLLMFQVFDWIRYLSAATLIVVMMPFSPLDALPVTSTDSTSPVSTFLSNIPTLEDMYGYYIYEQQRVNFDSTRALSDARLVRSIENAKIRKTKGIDAIRERFATEIS